MSVRIDNDKYYTNYDVAYECVKEALEAIQKVDPEFDCAFAIESAAGTGAFMKAWSAVTSNQIPCYGYDLFPEPLGVKITERNFLDPEDKHAYTAGTIHIGNPPFGIGRERLYPKFLKSALSESDYACFVLPMSQYDNYWRNHAQGELIFSKNLGEQKYQHRTVHCCFNVYKKWTLDNPRPKLSLYPSSQYVLEQHYINEGITPVEYHPDLVADSSFDFNLDQ